MLGHPKKSSYSDMYAHHTICNFETTIRKSIYGFMLRLENSTNSIIGTKMLMVLCTLFIHINIIPTRQKIYLI